MYSVPTYITGYLGNCYQETVYANKWTIIYWIIDWSNIFPMSLCISGNYFKYDSFQHLTDCKLPRTWGDRILPENFKAQYILDQASGIINLCSWPSSRLFHKKKEKIDKRFFTKWCIKWAVHQINQIVAPKNVPPSHLWELTTTESSVRTTGQIRQAQSIYPCHKLDMPVLF